MPNSFISFSLRTNSAQAAWMIALGTAVVCGGTADAQIRKENNSDALNLSSSWIGGNVPGPTDIAQWDNAVLGANTSDLGAALSWQGIKVLDPGGNVTVTGTSPNTLTLGTSGIDLSGSTRNMTISAPLVLGAAQPWSVAAGRVLSVTTPGAGAISGAGPLTINGPGQVRLGGVGASYTYTGGTIVGGGTGLNNVAATGPSPTPSNINLFIDFAAVVPGTTAGTTGQSLNIPTLTVGGGLVHTLGGAGTSGQVAFTVTSNSLIVAAGQSNFTMQRGSSGRVIYQFNGTPARSVGGTINFRDDINGSGASNLNGGGYRMNNVAVVNGIVPYVTYTTTSTNTSFFVPSPTGNGTVNNGSAYSAFTDSTATSLGTSIQNSTVVTNVNLTGPAATINSIRFNDATSRTVTLDPATPLTIGAGAILVTNNGTAGHSIVGGSLMGGDPGSGSGKDLIIFQLNNTASFLINSNIVNNVSATALTKSGAGTLILGGTNSYTGGTFVDAGPLLVNGSLSAASAVTVKRGGILGGTGAVNGSITLESGGKLSPGATGIESLDGSSFIWNSDNAVSGMTFDLSAVDNTSDVLSLSGAYTKGAGTAFLWDFTGGSVGQTYTLTTFLSSNFVAGDFGIATTGYLGAFTVGTNSVSLQLTQVPEPASCVLLIGGLGIWGVCRRRV